MSRKKNKRTDRKFQKSKAVKQSSQKAAEASALKKKQLKGEKKREAGKQEPTIIIEIDIDTETNAQDTEVELDAAEELVAAEEPVEEPGQELAPKRESNVSVILKRLIFKLMLVQIGCQSIKWLLTSEKDEKNGPMLN